MTIKEELERAKQRRSYSENFTEEEEKSLKTITTGLQVVFVPKKASLISQVPPESSQEQAEPEKDKPES